MGLPHVFAHLSLLYHFRPMFCALVTALDLQVLYVFLLFIVALCFMFYANKHKPAECFLFCFFKSGFISMFLCFPFCKCRGCEIVALELLLLRQRLRITGVKYHLRTVTFYGGLCTLSNNE